MAERSKDGLMPVPCPEPMPRPSGAHPELLSVLAMLAHARGMLEAIPTMTPERVAIIRQRVLGEGEQ